MTSFVVSFLVGPCARAHVSLRFFSSDDASLYHNSVSKKHKRKRHRRRRHSFICSCLFDAISLAWGMDVQRWCFTAWSRESYFQRLYHFYKTVSAAPHLPYSIVHQTQTDWTSLALQDQATQTKWWPPPTLRSRPTQTPPPVLNCKIRDAATQTWDRVD